MAGWLITGKTVRTRHGDPMEFLSFEDESGIFETTFFPEAYRRYSPLVDRGRPYLLEGKVEQDWGATTLTVNRLSPIRRLSAAAKQPPHNRRAGSARLHDPFLTPGAANAPL